MKVCLDFDGVLHDNLHPVPGFRMGPPMAGALDAVRWLLMEGHEVVVCTANVLNPDDTHNHITSWLAYYCFPVLAVSRIKPVADVYVDDRALRFDHWGQALHALSRWDRFRGTVQHGRTNPQKPKRIDPSTRRIAADPYVERGVIDGYPRPRFD